MGKSKHTRRKNKCDGPTGLPSMKDIEVDEEIGAGGDVCLSHAVLNTIVDNLQGQVEDKTFALHSLASLFQTPDSIKDVVQQKIVRIAGPLLVDPSCDVRNAATGALRNLTSTGNPEICDLLIEQDIMTPLTALLQQYADGRQAVGKAVEAENTDTFGQAMHLLRNLCEGSSRAIHYFNDGNLLQILIKYINLAPERINITLAVVQCLITVCEDNSHACDLLRKSEEDLLKILNLEGNASSLLLLRVLTAGVLLKLASKGQEMLSPALINSIITPLLQDHRQIIHNLSSVEPGDLADDDAALREVGQLLEAQQVSLELLTNLCTDCDDDAMDLDSTSSEDMMSDINSYESETETDDCVASIPSVTLTPELHEIIVSKQLIQRIWEKTRQPAVNVCDLLHEHSGGQHLLESVVVLRSRAFQCLNNMISVLDIQDFGGPQEMFKIWSDASLFVFKRQDDSRILEAASATMRAALEKFAQNTSEHPFEVQLQDMEYIFSPGPNADPCVRANVVKTACMMGMITLPHATENSYKVVKCVGTFLLDACGYETELWVLAETLDSLMDLFSEDETDQIAAELGLIDRLQALLPSFRRKVHINKKKLGEHNALITTVNSNLSRFIKYKGKRIAGLLTS